MLQGLLLWKKACTAYCWLCCWSTNGRDLSNSCRISWTIFLNSISNVRRVESFDGRAMLSCSEWVNKCLLICHSHSASAGITISAFIVCVRVCLRKGKQVQKQGFNWKGAGGKIVGMFTHRWPHDGGIVIVRCPPPSWVQLALLMQDSSWPKHYLISSTYFHLQYNHFPLAIGHLGRHFVAFNVTAL